MVKVLHIFASLGRGGIETWLVNILRRKPENLHFDFLVHIRGGEYEQEVESLGCTIHHAPPIRSFRKYKDFLGTVLAENQYLAVHVHGQEFLGDIVRVAAQHAVPVRVAHCHSTTLARGKNGLEIFIRNIRRRLIERVYLKRYATHLIACSSEAGRFMLGAKWGVDIRCQVLYCGIDTEAFRNIGDQDVRQRYGIRQDTYVIGHVGSMGPGPAKNHFFLIEIFNKLVSENRVDAVLFLAGDGPQRGDIESRVKQLGLEGRVVMPGAVSDVPVLLSSLFDVFLLPSLWEGLPVSGLEAIAGGLFVVCSDRITGDFIRSFPGRIQAVSLEEGISEWVDSVVAAVHKKVPLEAGLNLIETSDFSLGKSMENLIRIYDNPN